MILEEFLTTYDIKPDPQQLAALQAAEGPVLLLAVPGSGKTTVLLARLGYLIHCCNVPPENILTVTYTVAATKELRSRFAARFGQELAARMEFRTINGLCARIIRLYERQGHTAFELVTDDRLNPFLVQIWQAHADTYPTDADLKSMRTAFTAYKNRMVKDADLTPDKLEKMDTRERTLAECYLHYGRLLRQNHWMDYDDQMVYAYAILRRQPALLQRIQRQWQYFCVDEAQDTSLIQHRVIQLLAGQSRNLFLVGDEDQSIYGFRAACPEELLNFEQQWPGAKLLFLEQNYRSTPQIVEKAAKFIEKNQSRRPKQMRTENAAGSPVEPLPCLDRADQYAKVAALLQQAHEQKQQTAVLYRENDSALPFIDLLTRQNIPYRARSVDGLFFTGRTLRDVQDYFALAQNPQDTDAFMRLYYKFGAAISRDTAENAARLAQYSGKAPLQLLLDNDNLSRRSLERLEDIKRHLGRLLSETTQRAVRRIRSEMGYESYLQERFIGTGQLDILEELARREPTYPGLLRRLGELQEIVRQGGSEGESYVVLSTIHSAKGLEFDRVVLADVCDGILPQHTDLGVYPDPEELAQLEEDRRLFYVGMTRARQQLRIVTFPGNPMLPSSFARTVFPPPPQEKDKEAQRAKKRRGLTLTLPKIFSGPAPDTAPFTEGVRVWHKVYGAGVILLRYEDTATIRFDNGREKTFLLTAALSAKALETEKNL